jgi:nitrogen regulatory protein PII-like uncharacterized protein
MCDPSITTTFFAHNLLGVEPPDWNRVSVPEEHEAKASGDGH